MPLLRARTIELFGGPSDGRVIDFDEVPKPFVLVRTDAHGGSVNPLARLFKLLGFQEQASSFVLAVYELDSSRCHERYCYLRSCVSNEWRVDSSHAAMVVQSSGRTLKPARLR